MIKYVVHCHFKECEKVSRRYEMQMFGQGAIGFLWVVEELNKAGYKGDFALEYELHLSKPEVSLKMFRDNFVTLFDHVLNKSGILQ